MIATQTPYPLIELTLIRLDGGTQSRVALNGDKIDEYAEHLENGGTLPPVVIYYDGTDYWMADGFHRYHAACRANWNKIESDIRQGTRRDAVLYSCGANADHGLPRTHEDKRRQVMTLLHDDEWSKWSDREIARRCKVSHNFVSELRRSLSSDDSEPRTYTTKHGTVATMQVGNIGQKPTPAAPVAPLSDEQWDSLANTDEPPPVTIEDRIIYRGKPARVIGLSGGTLTLREPDGAIRIFRPTEEEPLVKIVFPLGGFGTCPNCNQAAAWTASEESPGLLECGLCVHECDVDEIVPISETHPRAADAMLGAAKHFAYCPNCNTCHAKWQPVSESRWMCKACGTFVSDAAMQVFERDTIPTTGSKEWMVARLAALGMNVYRVVKHQDGTFTAAFDLNGRYTEAEAEDAAVRHGRAIVEAGYLLVKAGVNIDGTLYFTGVACPMVHFAIDPVTFGEATRAKLERIAPARAAPEAVPSSDPAILADDQPESPESASESKEWYTPEWVIAPARAALGTIALDPASCEAANAVVQADQYFDRQADGLSQDWNASTVWLNPPYGKPTRQWVEKMLSEYRAGHFQRGLLLVPAYTETEWMRSLREFPRAFLNRRVAFYGPFTEDSGARFPNVVIALGIPVAEFAAAFEAIGDVYVLYTGGA